MNLFSVSNKNANFSNIAILLQALTGDSEKKTYRCRLQERERATTIAMKERNDTKIKQRKLRAIALKAAIEKIPILLSQYWKK